MVADHGMNDKHDPDGSPRVHYLEDVLAGGGISDFHVILPITDPYVVHHGALGSFAWIHVPAGQVECARQAIGQLEGVEEIFIREESAMIYSHPTDRIGDLSVASDAQTALGSRPRSMTSPSWQGHCGPTAAGTNRSCRSSSVTRSPRSMPSTASGRRRKSRYPRSCA